MGPQPRRALARTSPYATNPFHTARDSGPVRGRVATTRTLAMSTALPVATLLVDETLQLVTAATVPADAVRLAALLEQLLAELRSFTLGETHSPRR